MPAGCVLCFCPLCSVRLPGHWAWHIRTTALLVPSFIRTITESKPAETKLSRDWALLGLTGPRSDQASRRGSSSSLTSTCYDLWTDSKKASDLICADSRPPLPHLPPRLESCLWFGFCCLEREEQGQATHRQEKARAKAVRAWRGGKEGVGGSW